MDGNNDNQVWLKGAYQIGRAIGYNARKVPQLVESEGLPAFKFNRVWFAIDDDLKAWTKKIARKYKPSRPK
jgi:hypothetical protein